MMKCNYLENQNGNWASVERNGCKVDRIWRIISRKFSRYDDVAAFPSYWALFCTVGFHRGFLRRDSQSLGGFPFVVPGS